MDVMARRRAIMAHIAGLVKKIIRSATGLVSFVTNVEEPTKVVCEFTPVQEGTGDPSPDNERPISGWTGCEIEHTGKNLVPDFNVTYEFWRKGWLNSSGGISSSSNPYITSAFVEIKPKNSYIFSGNSNGWKAHAFFDKDKIFISGTYKETNSGTAPQNAKYIRISIQPNRSGATYLPTTVQLELGSTATAHEPYQGETVKINWKLPDEYQEVEYLEANKKQYFWADIPIQDGLTVDAVQSFNAGDTFLFGGHADESNQNRSAFNGMYAGKIQGSYPKGYYNVGSGLEGGNRAVYHVVTTHSGGNRTVYVDDVLVSSASGANTVTETGAPCCVFANRALKAVGEDEANLSYAYSGRVYSLKVSKENVLLADYVPCYRKADSKPGMYDLVTGTFYVNQGTGDDFTVGPDASTLPGTVYGGTVTLNEDGSVDLMVDRAKHIENGSRNPAYFPWKEGDNVVVALFSKTSLPQADYATVSSTNAKKFLCDQRNSFIGINSNANTFGLTNFSCYRAYGNSFAVGFDPNVVGTTNSSLRAYLADNPISFVYPLRSSITYHFDNIGQLQSFLGANNIWHDMNGSITAEYYKKQ